MARRTSQPWPVGLRLDGGSERQLPAPGPWLAVLNQSAAQLIGEWFNAFGWR